MEGACLIEILHICMVIDTDRDTSQLFHHIHKMASEQY
jgi:hypothetical protein